MPEPQAAPPPPVSPPPPKRRRLWRLLRRAALGLVLLVLLAYLLRGWLFGWLIADIVEKRLAEALGGEWRVESVSGSYVGGLELAGVSLREPAAAGALTTVRIERVAVAWSLIDLLRGRALRSIEQITVDGVELGLDLSRPATNNDATADPDWWRAVPAWLPPIAVTDVNMAIHGFPGDESVDESGAARTLHLRQARLTVNEGAVSLAIDAIEAGERSAGAVQAGLTWQQTADALRLTWTVTASELGGRGEVSFDDNGIRLRGRMQTPVGEVALRGRLEGELRVTLSDGDLAELPAWLHELVPPGSLPRAGTLTATELRLQAGSPSALNVQARDLTWSTPGAAIDVVTLSARRQGDLWLAESLSLVAGPHRLEASRVRVAEVAPWLVDAEDIVIVSEDLGDLAARLPDLNPELVAQLAGVGLQATAARDEAGIVHLRELTLSHPQGTVQLQGRLGPVTPERWREAALELGGSLIAPGLGSAEFRIAGTPGDPVMSTDIALADTFADSTGLPIAAGTLSLRWSAGRLHLDNADLRRGRFAVLASGFLDGDANAGQATLTNVNLRVDDTDLLAGTDFGLTWSADGSWSVTPARLIGSAGEVQLNGERRDGLLRLDLALTRLDAGQIAALLALGGGQLHGQLSAEVSFLSDASGWTGRAALADNTISWAGQALQLAGVVERNASSWTATGLRIDLGEGLLVEADGTLPIDGDLAAVTGRLRAQAESTHPVVLPLLVSRVGSGSLTLDLAATDGRLDGLLTLAEVRPIVGGLMPLMPGLRLETRIAADQHGWRISGNGTLGPGMEVRAGLMAERSWHGDVLALLAGRGTDVTVSGGINADIDNLGPLRNLFPGLIEIGGEVHVDATIGGSAAALDLSGELRADQMMLRLDEEMPALRGGRIRAHIAGLALDLNEVSGQLGASTVHAEGRLGLAGPDLRLHGKHLLVSESDTLRVRADLDLRLNGPWSGLLLAGAVGITDLHYARSHDPLLAGSGPSSGNSEMLELFRIDAAPWSQMRFDVSVRDGGLDGRRGNLRIDADVLFARATIDLQLGGTGSLPLPLGRVELTEGRIALPAMTYNLRSAEVRWPAERPLNPDIDVLMDTRLRGIDVSVIVQGSYPDLTVTVRTDPPLPPDDALVFASTGLLTNDLSDDQAGWAVAGAFAPWLGRVLARSLLGGPRAGDPASWTERLELEVGREVSASGAGTLRASFWMLDWLAAVAERDRYDDFNSGLMLRWRFGPGGRLRPPPALAGEPIDRRAARRADWTVNGVDNQLQLQLLELVVRERAQWSRDRDAAAVADAVFQMQRGLRRDGHAMASVEALTEDDRVIFVVELGQRFTLTGAEFPGASEISRRRLAEAVASNAGLLGGQIPFTNALAREMAAAALALYRSEGYAEAEVGPPQPRLDPATGEAVVVLPVVEGPRLTVAAVLLEIAGEDTRTPRERRDLRRLLAAESDRPWRRELGRLIEAKVRVHLTRSGFLASDVTVTDAIESTTGQVTMTVTVNPGERRYLGRITVSGLQRTSRRFVRRSIWLRQHDALDRVAVDEGLRRVVASGAAQRAQVTLNERRDEDGVLRSDLDVSIEEGYDRGLSLELGWGSWEQLRGALRWDDTNLFGSGRDLRLEFSGSTRGYGGLGRLRDEEILDRWLGINADLSLTFSGNIREEPSFERRRLSGGLTATNRLSESLRVIVGYEYALEEARLISGGITDAEEEGRVADARIHLGLQRYRRGPLSLRSGWTGELGLSWSSPELGGDLEYIEYSAGIGGLLPLDYRERFVVVGGVRAATRQILDDRDTLPIQYRLFLGGAGSVRSFRQDRLGPVDAGGDPTGGLTRAWGSLELHWNLSQLWQIAVFGDSGSVDPEAWQLEEELGWALGVGLHLRLPIGPIGLDFAWNPGERFAESRAWALHLAAGFRF